MAKGGARSGAGRKPGSPNKRTIERVQEMEKTASIIASVIGEGAFEGDSHAFLIAIYKDPNQPPQMRLDAAKAAIAYEKPKLAAIEVTGDEENPVAVRNKIEFVVVDSAKG